MFELKGSSATVSLGSRCEVVLCQYLPGCLGLAEHQFQLRLPRPAALLVPLTEHLQYAISECFLDLVGSLEDMRLQRDRVERDLESSRVQ